MILHSHVKQRCIQLSDIFWRDKKQNEHISETRQDIQSTVQEGYLLNAKFPSFVIVIFKNIQWKYCEEMYHKEFKSNNVVLTLLGRC